MDDFSQKVSRRTVLQLGGLGAISLFLNACARAANPAPSSGGANSTQFQGVNSGKGAPVQTPSDPNQVMVTSNADFYTVAYNDYTPAVPGDWKLTVGGNVDKPMTLTLDEIKAMPAVAEMRTLECISNTVGGPLISNANWKGIKMADLMNRVGVKPNTVEVKLESFDGYHTSIPLDLAMHEHSLLVYEMNGEPLPVEHGQPLRCLWPGRYGMKQPKWLQKITAITEHHTGYWEGQGWSNEARVQPNSRIDQPEDVALINTPTFQMNGVGYSSDDGIKKIEVSLDDGKTWQDATLVRGPSPYVWTNWRWEGPTPADGQYTLLARVTDNSGRTQMREQISLLGGTFPNGTSAIHSVVINVKKV